MEEISTQDIRLIEVARILSEYAKRFEELIKVKIQDNDKIASGKLLASISTKVELNGAIYTVKLNSLKYLQYIEYGRKPGKWPPREPILQWVKDKRLPTAEYTGDKKLPTEKQMAYLVSKKIGTEGISPTPMVAETEEELNALYLPRLEEALKTDIINALPLIKVQLSFGV